MTDSALFDLLHRKTPAIEEEASRLRSTLESAVKEGNAGRVTQNLDKMRRIFDPEKDTLIYHALYEPNNLVFALKPDIKTEQQRRAFFHIEAELTGLTQRLNDALHEKKSLEREQKDGINSALNFWLAPEELQDKDTFKKATQRLQYYRSYNPYNRIHKKSLVEVFAEGEKNGSTYNAILQNLLQEWSEPGNPFTIEQLANHLLKGVDNVSHDRMVQWLEGGLNNIHVRDRAMEALCANTGAHLHDETMLWRLARGDSSIIIGENDSPGEIYRKSQVKSGIPSIRLLPMIGIEVEAASCISREVDNRRLPTPQALQLLECAQPAASWLTKTIDKEKFDKNFKAARCLNHQLPMIFGQIIAHALDTDRPYKTLIDAVIGKAGIRPTDIHELGRRWKEKIPNGCYNPPNTERLKLQASKSSPLTEAEAEVIIDLAKEVYPFITKEEQDACIEILTRCPATEELIDRYITQTDSNNKPAEVKLKHTLESVAARKGKVLSAKNIDNLLVTTVSDVVLTPLRNEDRLGVRSAPSFADALTLTGERRRKFLVKAQGGSLCDPMDIIDDVLGGKIEPKEGIKMLIAQTGYTQTSFAEAHKLSTKEFMRIINEFGQLANGSPAHLANDLGRPELSKIIEQTFGRHKDNKQTFEHALEERKSHFQSFISRKALEIAAQHQK